MLQKKSNKIFPFITLVKTPGIFHDVFMFILGAIPAFCITFIIGINPSVTAFLVALVVFFEYLRRRQYFKIKKISLLNILFLFVLNFGMGYFIIGSGVSVFYIPFTIIPMLVTILFGELVISLLLTIASAVCIAALIGNSFALMLIFLTGGIISIVLVFGVRRRITVIRAGFFIGMLQAGVLFLLNHFKIINSGAYTILIANGFASGIIVLGVLPLFEYLFKTITNITLLELADFNQPLLNRVMLEAPGTYHHSLIVGNLADAASRAIGANALLARIGAYYHDIGKLQKPEYFSENQKLTDNKHDTLAPNMSKMIIMNHVKEGVEMAEKYHLSPQIIEFIEQHHGNSLVYYFYRRALERLEEDQGIKEEGFRYPGPKPNTKETAIVLLADAVEAASRTLKEPTAGRIEEVVHKIINNKFIDGQLDECDLTLKDMERIASVFVRVLGGMYHPRVDYPDHKHQTE